MLILLVFTSYTVDEQINELFKNFRFVFADFILSIITNSGIVFVVMLIIPSIILYKKNIKLVYLLYLTFISSIILSLIIKLIVLRQRPVEAVTYPFVNILNYSFPSMHTMTSFSLVPILKKFIVKQKYFWIIFAFLVGFSRIYFGFHFISDVVFGAVLGYFLGNFLLQLYENGRLWSK